jgi:hypothetical protein
LPGHRAAYTVFQKLVRRNKLAFAAATAVIAALVSGIVISSWQAIRAERARQLAQMAEQNEAKQRQFAEEQRRSAEEQRKIAVEQRQSAEEHARQLRRLLYVGDMSKAFQAIKDGDLGLATSLMTNYFHQPDGEDLRGWEWRYLWQLCQINKHQILAHADQAMNAVVFSPDGRLLATAGSDKIVRVFEVDSYKPVTNLSGFNETIYCRAMAFSPDGRLLAAKGGQMMRAFGTPRPGKKSFTRRSECRIGTTIWTLWSFPRTGRHWRPKCRLCPGKRVSASGMSNRTGC